MSLLRRAQKVDGKFQNPVPTRMGGLRTMLKVVPLYFSNREEVEPKKPLGPFRTDVSVYATPPVSGLRVTWFGHSSLLIEIDGYRVLIDPVWEQRASPVQFMGPKRFFPPTLPLEQLPPLDVVLVSHDHYDHFGAGTVKRLASLPVTASTRWVTSAGVERHLQKLGVPAERTTGLDWTESVEISGQGGPLRLTSWPSRHFSGRWVSDRFSTLWGAFVLEGPRHRIYFGGDSGYWSGFRDVASHYDRFDLILLEIGAFHPLWEEIHLGPDNAVRAYEDMREVTQVGPLFPIHWGLFNLALHGWRQPIERLTELSAQHDIPLWLPTPGVPTDVLPGEMLRSSWWHPV